MAFISSSKNSNIEDSNTACVTTASTAFPTGSVNVATISQDTASAYIASQSNGSQIKFKDINQIDEDDMEEIDIKWSMALLSMRADKWVISQENAKHPEVKKEKGKKAIDKGLKLKKNTPKALMVIDGVGWDWSYMANKGESHALVADEEAPTEFALMANTESKVFDNSLCSNKCKKNTDSLNSKIKDLKSELSEANNFIYHYKLAVAQLGGRLTEYKEREVKYIEKIRTLEMYRASNLKCIKTLDKELEGLKLEKDGLDGKLAGLLKASKNLDHLIGSQRSDQVKEGVGYNAVPPPAADLYLSPKKDLSWTGLPEFVDDTVTDYTRPSPTISSTLEEEHNGTIYAYLGQHEYHANEVRLMTERNSDPLALISQHQLNRTPYSHHHPLYQQSQFQPQATSYQSSQYGPTYHNSQFVSSGPSSLTHSISYPGTDASSLVNHNAYMASFSAPQIAYAQMDQQSPEYSPPEVGLVVPVFQRGDDPIDAINHMMSFLTSVVSSRYPATNNQLRTSSNPRQ
nr:hypothetical protein [Tanacetum cinerariifolium]